MAIAEDLDFDVASAADVALHEDGVVAEGGAGLLAGLFEAGREIGGFVDDAHASAATTEGSLDDEGEADGGGHGDGLVDFVDGLFGAWDDGNGGLLGEFAGGAFVAEEFEEFGGGADESDAVLGAGAGEGGVFGEEAVAGVDGIDTFFGGHGDDAVDIEVGLNGTFALADQVGFVGLEAVEGESVFLGEDGHGSDAQLVSGTEDADGDFATIQGQQFFHENKRKFAEK